MAFQQGLSGLSVSAKALDVVSNNIANASTIGFKGGQAQFSDVYAASLGVGGGSQVGIGASLPVVQQQFSQGNISNSTNPLDIAVNGSGFFRLQKSETDQTVTYTRNGQFHLNELGSIVNAQNNNVTGYPIVNNVTNRATLVPVKLDTTGVVPRATGAAEINPGIVTQINMDDRDLKSLSSPTPNTLLPWTNVSAIPNTFTPDLNSFNYSTSVTVYDQKGNDHALSMYFSRLGNSEGTAPAKNLWNVHYVLDSADITNQMVAGTTGDTGVPTLEFLESGKISKGGNLEPFNQTFETFPVAKREQLTIPASGTSTLAFTPVGAITVTSPDEVTTYVDGTDYMSNNPNPGDISYLLPPLTVGAQVLVKYNTPQTPLASDYIFNIDVAALATAHPEFAGLFPADIPINFDNSTLFGSGYDVNKLTQDGYAYGRLSGVSVSSDGILRGSYSNGQTKDISQLVLVDFVSPTGLASLGNNQWGETAASGQPLVGDPGTGNRGVLQSAAVEEANVDLTQELVSLITMQRNYQANAQSIKTQDQILQTLVNLR
jgi:flagellar hook protein FlgE